MPLFRSLLCLLAAALLGVRPAPAQDPSKADDEVQKLAKVDPFTDGDPKKMQALGVERYGPFPWADFVTTADVDKVLGEGRVLWMETEHFRIGLNFATAPWPAKPAARKSVLAECAALHDRLRDFPERPKKLGPWVRLHLYAARCERAYGQFLELIGATDADFPKPAAGAAPPGKGPYLGLPDKFLLLLFQKKSDMARYMKRFCDVEADDSMRFYHDKTHQVLLCVSAEGMEGFDESGLHSHVLYGLWQNLMNGYRGFSYPLPIWLSLGIAHYYSRQVETEFVNARIRDDESVDQESQNQWVQKVMRRARHDGACFPFETMNSWAKWEEIGFQSHVQSWSRVDYLMQVDAKKVGELLKQLKALPNTGDYDGQGAAARKLAPKLLYELFELDGPTFDERWRDWVRKIYPKRKDGM